MIWKPSISRRAFIAAYAQDSEPFGGVREATVDGCMVNGHERIALPCNCGEPNCEGWAMVGAEKVAAHMILFGRREG